MAIDLAAFRRNAADVPRVVRRRIVRRDDLGGGPEPISVMVSTQSCAHRPSTGMRPKPSAYLRGHPGLDLGAIAYRAPGLDHFALGGSWDVRGGVAVEFGHR